MPTSRIICAGWVHPRTGVRHPCGKVLGEVETDHGRDSHGICPDCFRSHMTEAGYSQEEIDRFLDEYGSR
jgi:hypothetical protein